MKSKPNTPAREPSHTSRFIWIALIVLVVVVLAIAVAKLVAYIKIFGF